MEWIEAHLDFLVAHLLAVVFAAFLIEAAGFPFPTRILLLVAATLAEPRQLAGLVAVTTAGPLVGEQAAEILGRHGGARLLLLIGPLALATLVAYRLWRRRRYGPAKSEALQEQASCVEGVR